MAANAAAIAALPRHCSDQTAWNELVSRQKDFRLLSLRTDPDAFGSTYDRELQFTWDTWENRLKNPQATTFVAFTGDPTTGANAHDESEAREVLRREWLGQLVLLRMYQEDRAKLSANKSPWTVLKDGDTDSNAPRHYHFNGLFVVPSARGQGIARKLIEHALASSSHNCNVTPKYTVIVWAENEAAQRAFQGCGFKVIGQEMYESGSPERPRQEPALMLEFGVSS